MEQDQSTNTATRYLTSLCRHARKHGLGADLAHITVPQLHNHTGEVHVWPPKGTSRVSLLLRWVDTLTAPAVTITYVDVDIHTSTTGGLVDGTMTSVTVVFPPGNEQDLLCANVNAAAGVSIPVELLRSLMSADAAESRTDETTLAGVS